MHAAGLRRSDRLLPRKVLHVRGGQACAESTVRTDDQSVLSPLMPPGLEMPYGLLLLGHVNLKGPQPAKRYSHTVALRYTAG